ncbi:MAG: SRPBCC domain-containing protein [Flavobacteriaceae bacterium]|nr:SRPBCC domain-containing protein [Flavobacteriaceae bacterium]MDG1927258.1 SRPBCC domain-containing protein [Flavobacteriaceae bacterium]MDO7569889.1 SRPBCC domain-containing protein [Flavobacteriaceae bacterium]
MKSNTSSLWAKVSITVPITKEKVWDVLTLPELTQRYMYNCQLHSSWELGSKAIWSAQLEDGSWHDHVVANVVVHNPYEQITLEIIHQATEEYPSEVSRLYYNLETVPEGTLLSIKQGDFNTITSGEKRHLSCQQGWDFILPKLIETCT